MAGKQLTTSSSGVVSQLQSKEFVQQLRRGAPRDVDAERMARIALTIVRQDPKIASCDPQSLLGAVMMCAQTGLEPGPMQHCAIIPYGKRATWQIMVKGLLHLLYRSDRIAAVQAGVARKGDRFSFDEGSAPFIKFRRSLTLRERERIAAFASIIPREGPPLVRVMPIWEVERIRDQYAQATSGPWVTEFDEMAQKTVIKRLAKLAPVSAELTRAISWDDQGMVGQDQLVDMEEEIDVTPAPTKGNGKKGKVVEPEVMADPA